MDRPDNRVHSCYNLPNSSCQDVWLKLAPKTNYDTTKPEDVQRGFDDLMHGLIYGDLLEQMFEKVKETGKLEDHPSVVQAGHEYMLLK